MLFSKTFDYFLNNHDTLNRNKPSFQNPLENDLKSLDYSCFYILSLNIATSLSISLIKSIRYCHIL
jgi:hypothetical protein